MEKDSFQIDVPLPNQKVATLDLSQLPPNVLRSQTLDLVIRWQEELVARLNVTLRRNLLLEEQIFSLEEMTLSLRKECDVLSDQISVFREQDQVLRSRTEYLERNLEQVKDDVVQSETRLADHSMSLQEKIARLKLTNDQLQKQLKRHRRYRRRVQERARPYLKAIKLDKGSLSEQLKSRDSEFRQLQSRMSDTVAHLQKLSREKEQDQRRLTDEYTKAVHKLDEENETLKVRNTFLEEKLKAFDQLVERNAQLENQLVQMKRQVADEDKQKA